MAISQSQQDSKFQRIDLRTTAEIKNTLVLAAKLLGTTVSGFLINAAYKQAQSLLKTRVALKKLEAAVAHEKSNLKQAC
jgi:uncharacterized protein (DUF1778 family)